jgi:hypothetical protein
VRLLRTIRLDPSDTFVFDHVAEPGEWAVSGTFMFADDDPATLEPKRRAAFRQAFVGVASLGFSTLAVVTLINEAERQEAITQLAHSFMTQLGAPDLASAEAAAIEEIAFSSSLCQDCGTPYPAGTVIALNRSHQDGGIREQFRALSRREKNPDPTDWISDARAFAIIEVDDTSETEEQIEERIDLASLADNKA